MAIIPVILKYKPVDRYKEYCVEIDTSSSVEDFRFQIFSLTDVEPESQRIILNGRWLKDNDDMNKLGLQAGQTIVMTEASNAEGSLLIDTKEKVEIVEIVSKPESAQGQTIPVDLEKSGIAKSSTVIAPNYHILKSTDPANDWFKLFKQFNSPIQGYGGSRGGRARVAILDTGIDLAHPDLATEEVQRIQGRRNFLLGEIPDEVADQDAGRHGTKIATLLLKLAPLADIYVARVKRDKKSPLRPECIVNAINYAIEPWNVDIISMSWGFETEHGSVAHAICKAFDKQKIIFAAASNYGANLPANLPVTFPASMPEVICVNSSDGYGNKSDFNPPPREDDYNFCTLGEAVPWSSKEAQPGKRETGTSFATPIAAAIATSFIEFTSQAKFWRFKIPDELKGDVRTRNGILKIFVAISRDMGGFHYLQPWDLLRCGECRDQCRQSRETAARKIFNILKDELLPPEDLKRIARILDLEHVDEADARAMYNDRRPVCLDRTRVDLRRQIMEWANNSCGKRIYWLCGMLGTGKSTVARTIALEFSQQERLGASFFFSKDREDLRNTSKFVSTIAYQLAKLSPTIRLAISKEKKKDRFVEKLSMRMQWDRLIHKPLSLLKSRPQTIVVVIDALDECAAPDIETLLELFVDAKKLQNVDLRILLTSRPEDHIRNCFLKLSEEVEQPLLDNVDTTDSDISVLIRHELTDLHRYRQGLDAHWLGEENIGLLTQRAARLFIYATMTCRYIKGLDGDTATTTAERLSRVLRDKDFDSLDDMYSYILTQAIKGLEKDVLQLSEQFRLILGLILVLLEPMPVTALGEMCEKRLELEIVCARLNSLRSVLVVPESGNAPVRIFHPSFRDFLLQRRCKDSRLWIDEKEAHRNLFHSCIRLMSSDLETRLKRDICDIGYPGIKIYEINRNKIKSRLQNHTRYACRYWVGHLEKVESSQRREVELCDNGTVHKFLQENLLHWLEALSLDRKISEGGRAIQLLVDMVDVDKSPKLHAFVHDANRFFLYNRSIIEVAPLQTYCSALVFSPQQSLVRKQFEKELPKWIERLPEVPPGWTSLRQTLEGHRDTVSAVSFSPDGKMVASASNDGTVRLWDAATGAALWKLEGHRDRVNSVAFSHNGKRLVSGSDDKTVRIWDAKKGNLHIRRSHKDPVKSVAFSYDGRLIASGSDDKTARIWEAERGALQQKLIGHVDSVYSVTFSRNGGRLASGSGPSTRDWTVRIWGTEKGELQRTLQGHTNIVFCVLFFQDDQRLASCSADNTIRFWDTEKGTLQDTFKGHLDSVNSIVFSNDERQLASGSDDRTIRIWNIETKAFQIIKSYKGKVKSIAFSPDGQGLASGSDDNTIRIWDVKMEAPQQTLEGSNNKICLFISSHNGRWIASRSNDKPVLIWDVETGVLQQKLERIKSVAISNNERWVASGLQQKLEGVKSVAFSNNERLVASGLNNTTVQIWDIETRTLQQTLTGHYGVVNAVIFSYDDQRLASGSDDGTVRIWDVNTEEIAPHIVLQGGRRSWIMSVVFSHNGRLVASGLRDTTTQIWDVETRTLLHTVGNQSHYISSMMFSYDGRWLASGSLDRGVRIWSTETGEIQWAKTHKASVHSITFSHDGKRLASGSDDRTIRIWNAESGTLLQTLTIGTSITKLSFTSDDLCLITDLGSIALGQPSLLPIRALNWTGYCVSSDGLWITWNGNKVLWFPPEYRPVFSIVKERTIAIGCDSGRVFMIKFNSNIPQIQK